MPDAGMAHEYTGLRPKTGQLNSSLGCGATRKLVEELRGKRHVTQCGKGTPDWEQN